MSTALNKLLPTAILALCLFAAPGHAASPEAKAAPVVERVLELMRSGDQATSLGAMLLSVRVSDYWRLEPFVRQSISHGDPQWVKAVKAYTLYCYTLTHEDAARYIEALPEDRENFNALIDFEGSVTRQPGSDILRQLLPLSTQEHNKALRELALVKLERLHRVADGWVAEWLGASIQ
jgi:hypothetical protein